MAGQTRIDGNLIDTGTDPNDIVSVSVGDARYPRLSEDNTLAGNLTVDGDLNLVATGAGTGVFTIAAPDSNTNRTLTLPDEAGTVLTDVGVPSSAMPAGSVIQVVSTVKQSVSSFSVDKNSFPEIPGLSVTLTPRDASSKFQILATVSHGMATSGTVAFRPERNGSNIPDASGNSGFVQNIHSAQSYPNNNRIRSATVNFLDSPSTTSPVTYSIATSNDQINNYTVYINQNADNTIRGVSVITVMEIAG